MMALVPFLLAEAGGVGDAEAPADPLGSSLLVWTLCWSFLACSWWGRVRLAVHSWAHNATDTSPEGSPIPGPLGGPLSLTGDSSRAHLPSKKSQISLPLLLAWAVCV